MKVSTVNQEPRVPTGLTELRCSQINIFIIGLFDQRLGEHQPLLQTPQQLVSAALHSSHTRAHTHIYTRKHSSALHPS